MPYEAPGIRHVATAAGAAFPVTHGDPVIMNGFPGIAFKNAQLGRFQDPTAAAATQIAVGEVFDIQLGGIHEVRAARLTGGIGAFPVGTTAFIIDATGMLEVATAAGRSKFGRVTEVRGTVAVRINADARDTF